MSQSITLYCPPRATAADLFAVGHPEALGYWYPDESLGGCYQLRAEPVGWYISIHPIADIGWIDECESDEDYDVEFRGVVRGLHPIWIVYNASAFEPVRDLVARFLGTLGSDARLVWLNTDYGWVVRGDDILDRVAADPGWDWRVDFDPMRERP